MLKRKTFMRPVIALAVSLFFSSTLFAKTTHLTLLHFNDFHGKFEGVRENGKEIGAATETIQHGRNKETPIGDWSADALRQRMKADAGIINSGGIRGALSKGNITVKDIHEIYPFDNYLVVLKMTGADLKNVLDRSAGAKEGGFLQVSGIKFRIFDKRAVDITVDGAPLDLNRVYTVATVDFLANGGDGYAMLKKMPSIVSKILMRDAVVDHVKKAKKISAPEGGRIVQNSK